MQEKLCGGVDIPDGWECGKCGNHVCGRYVQINGSVCPMCFGRLYRSRN